MDQKTSHDMYKKTRIAKFWLRELSNLPSRYPRLEEDMANCPREEKYLLMMKADIQNLLSVAPRTSWHDMTHAYRIKLHCCRDTKYFRICRDDFVKFGERMCHHVEKCDKCGKIGVVTIIGSGGGALRNGVPLATIQLRVEKMRPVDGAVRFCFKWQAYDMEKQIMNFDLRNSDVDHEVMQDGAITAIARVNCYFVVGEMDQRTNHDHFHYQTRGVAMYWLDESYIVTRRYPTVVGDIVNCPPEQKYFLVVAAQLTNMLSVAPRTTWHDITHVYAMKLRCCRVSRYFRICEDEFVSYGDRMVQHVEECERCGTIGLVLIIGSGGSVLTDGESSATIQLRVENMEPVNGAVKFYFKWQAYDINRKLVDFELRKSNTEYVLTNVGATELLLYSRRLSAGCSSLIVSCFHVTTCIFPVSLLYLLQFPVSSFPLCK